MGLPAIVLRLRPCLILKFSYADKLGCLLGRDERGCRVKKSLPFSFFDPSSTTTTCNVLNFFCDVVRLSLVPFAFCSCQL